MARLMWLLGCTALAMSLAGCIVDDVAHEQAFACDTDGACVLGFVCVDGACVSPAPVACAGCEGDCVNDVCLAVCEGPADCSDGLTTCQDGQCRPPPDCGPGGTCDAGQICGPLGICVADPAACGAEPCALGEVCVAGACWTECGERRLCALGSQCVEWGCAEPCEGGLCGEDEACVDGACQGLCECPNDEHCDDGPCRCGEGPACGDGLRCIDGACMDSCDDACSEGEPCVDGQCVDGCNNTCSDGEVCQDGACMDGCNNACTDDEICENGGCVDTCNNRCVDDEFCVGGVCKCNGLRCADGLRCIAGLCQDACGNACELGSHCDESGDCLCGAEICEAGVACVNGACDRPCVGGCGASEECVLGACLCGGEACAVDEVCSRAQACVDACGGDADCGGDAQCAEGQCVCGDLMCGQADVCLGGACVDRCVLCQPGEGCEAGVCQCGAGACVPGDLCVDNACVPSCAGVACERDEVCAREQCAVACAHNVECPRNTACLEGGCVPSCGGNEPCSGDEVCLQGQCRPACDGPCPEGEFCVDAGGFDECICEEAGVTCGPNAACLDGHCAEVCGEGICGPGQGCLEGQCAMRCFDDAGCGEGTCVEGLCVTCLFDWECEEGLVCTGGRCDVLGCGQDADCGGDRDGDGQVDRICDAGICAQFVCDEGCCDGNGVQVGQYCTVLAEIGCAFACAPEITTLSFGGSCDRAGRCVEAGDADVRGDVPCAPGAVCVELDGEAICAPEEEQLCPPDEGCVDENQYAECAPGARCVGVECSAWACERETCNDWGPAVRALNGALVEDMPGVLVNSIAGVGWNRAIGGPFVTRAQAHQYCEMLQGGWYLPSWFELVTALPLDVGALSPVGGPLAQNDHWYVSRTVLETGEYIGARLPTVRMAPIPNGTPLYAICMQSPPQALDFLGRAEQMHQTNQDTLYGVRWTSLQGREQTAAGAAQICAGLGRRLPTVQEVATLLSWNADMDPAQHLRSFGDEDGGVAMGLPIDLLRSATPGPVWTSQDVIDQTWVVNVRSGVIEPRGDALQADVRTLCISP